MLARLFGTDAEAMDAARDEIENWPGSERVQYVDSADAAAAGADAIILVTEWSRFEIGLGVLESTYAFTCHH